MSVTYDLTSNSSTSFNSLFQVYRRAIPEECIRHCTSIALDDASPVAGDVLKMITIPKNTWVWGVAVNIHTATTTTGSPTVTLGDSSSGTTYLGAIDATSTGFTVTPATKQKFYTSADYITVVLGTTAPTNGIVDVVLFSTNIPDYAAE